MHGLGDLESTSGAMASASNFDFDLSALIFKNSCLGQQGAGLP
jgi:hypothetical protein